VAAVSVLGYHTAYFVARATGFKWFSGAFGGIGGRALASLDLGLFVFFVLSGYLISGPFVRAFVAGRPLPRIRPYLANRLLRIVPAFWGVLTILLLLVGSYGGSPGAIAMVFGFAQNYGNSKFSHVIGQAWTLDVEIAFYALVPVVAFVLARAFRSTGERGRRNAVFAALVGTALASLALRALGPDTVTPGAFAWQTSLPAMVFAFLPGIALAAAETSPLPARLRRRGSRLPATALLAGGVLLCGLYAALAPASSPQFLDAGSGLLAALGTGTVVGAVLCLQWSTGTCWRALDNRPMRWIGKRSYSLYLVHQVIAAVVVFALVRRATSPGLGLALALPVVLGVSLVAAAASYRAFERPFLSLRSALGDRRPSGVDRRRRSYRPPWAPRTRRTSSPT
jgi:peptidoglycan/LPS O-acetylase OafA/YrhL